MAYAFHALTYEAILSENNSKAAHKGGDWPAAIVMTNGPLQLDTPFTFRVSKSWLSAIIADHSHTYMKHGGPALYELADGSTVGVLLGHDEKFTLLVNKGSYIMPYRLPTHKHLYVAVEFGYDYKSISIIPAMPAASSCAASVVNPKVLQQSSDTTQLRRELQLTNQECQQARTRLRDLEGQLEISQRIQQELERTVQQTRAQLEEKTTEVAYLNEQIACEVAEKEQLRIQLQQQSAAAAEQVLPREFQQMSMIPAAMSDRDRAQVYQMKAQLAESQMHEIYTLFTSKVRDFDIKRLIDNGQEGAVFLAISRHPRIRDKGKEYALKVMFNIFQYTTVTQLRRAYQNEYELLATLPFHDNIVRLLAFFYDRMGENLPGMDRFDALRNQARTLSLFLVMEYLPVNLDVLSKQYRNAGQLTLEVLLDWGRQLAEAANFLTLHNIVHRDMKLNNVLVSRDGVLKVCDFGLAIQTPTADLTIRYFPYVPIGGNPAHLAPEVLSISGSQGQQDGVYVNYQKQCVWELGVLMHELVMGHSPFEGIDQQGYRTDDLPNISIPRSAANQDAAQHVSVDLQAMVQRMLSFEPERRPTISQVLTTLTQYAERFPIP